jgi:hypothetical protein
VPTISDFLPRRRIHSGNATITVAPSGEWQTNQNNDIMICQQMIIHYEEMLIFIRYLLWRILAVTQVVTAHAQQHDTIGTTLVSEGRLQGRNCGAADATHINRHSALEDGLNTTVVYLLHTHTHNRRQSLTL